MEFAPVNPLQGERYDSVFNRCVVPITLKVLGGQAGDYVVWTRAQADYGNATSSSATEYQSLATVTGIFGTDRASRGAINGRVTFAWGGAFTITYNVYASVYRGSVPTGQTLIATLRTECK